MHEIDWRGGKRPSRRRRCSHRRNEGWENRILNERCWRCESGNGASPGIGDRFARSRDFRATMLCWGRPRPKKVGESWPINSEVAAKNFQTVGLPAKVDRRGRKDDACRKQESRWSRLDRSSNRISPCINWPEICRTADLLKEGGSKDQLRHDRSGRRISAGDTRIVEYENFYRRQSIRILMVSRPKWNRRSSAAVKRPISRPNEPSITVLTEALRGGGSWRKDSRLNQCAVLSITAAPGRRWGT